MLASLRIVNRHRSIQQARSEWDAASSSRRCSLNARSGRTEEVVRSWMSRPGMSQNGHRISFLLPFGNLAMSYTSCVCIAEHHVDDALCLLCWLQRVYSMVQGADFTSNTDIFQKRAFGYTQVLHRTWGQWENICASFCALYFVGGIRYVFSVGLQAGGPPAIWSSWIITSVCCCITAAVLAEVCSSIPLSGSIYIWAAECAGPKYGRLAGFVVAFWSTTAWTSFLASINQGAMYYLLSEWAVFNVDFPGGLDSSNIKFRAATWGGAQIMLWSAVLINLIHPRTFRWVFLITAGIMMTDWLLTMIWLPIGVSKTYGFQDASWWTTYYNGTGAPDGWNWILSLLFTSGVLTGFDASGHVAEETKNASLTAARGIFWSCFISAVLGTSALFLFIASSPSFDVLFGIEAPQPFVIIYQMALGNGGQVVMTVIAILGLWLNSAVCIIAASRLVFAIARDGILPGSSWIGRVKEDGQPKNAILFVGIVASLILCTILPSPVAFTSLVSAGAIPTIAAYALIAFLRIFVTPGQLKMAKWSNGRFSKPFLWVALIWNLIVLATLISPYYFPVTADTLNYAPVILGAVTIFAIISYFIVPEEKWLSRRRIQQVRENEAYGRATPSSQGNTLVDEADVHDKRI